VIAGFKRRCEMSRSSVRLIPLVLLLLVRSTPVPSAQEYENDPGWTWLLSPGPIMGGSWTYGGVMGTQTRDAENNFILTAAWEPEENCTYRAVAFDAAGDRHTLTGGWSQSGHVRLSRFVLEADELPIEEVAALGIEKLTAEGWKKWSLAARERAEREGMEILPLPEVEKPYAFRLTSMEGEAISSGGLRGRVVVIDGWATWCHPCMKKMPELEALYERWHDEGLEVVGLNWDREAGKAEEAVTSLGIEWPQVFVPADPETRDLWYQVSSIRTLPRILVIDRDGVLRVDTGSPLELESAVSALMTGESLEERTNMAQEGGPKTGTIGWIDLTIENAPEVRDFYAGVTGWKFDEVDMGGYSDFTMMAPATGEAVAGICHARGGNAGMPPQWIIYVVVNDLDESLERCRELGGDVVVEPKTAGEQGRYCVIRDPAGAVAALYEPAS
jgi:predicted enzyme related to lactoylglutathione lyase/thiol-disulfide isomerase/thioredoxin